MGYGRGLCNGSIPVIAVRLAGVVASTPAMTTPKTSTTAMAIGIPYIAFADDAALGH